MGDDSNDGYDRCFAVVFFVSPRHALGPELSVEQAVIDGFLEVFEQHDLACCQVGDGACDAQDFVMGAGGQAQIIDAGAEQFTAGRIELTATADLPRAHLAVVACAVVGEASRLNLTGLQDLFVHLSAAGSLRIV